MEKIRKLLKRIKFVYRRSNTLTKVVVASAIVLSMAALLALNLTIAAIENRTENLTGEASRLEQENQTLEENIGQLGTAEGIIQIAKDLWNMVFPDTIVVQPED